jgi:hypothetical protein
LLVVGYEMNRWNLYTTAGNWQVRNQGLPRKSDVLVMPVDELEPLREAGHELLKQWDGLDFYDGYAHAAADLQDVVEKFRAQFIKVFEGAP